MGLASAAALRWWRRRFQLPGRRSRASPRSEAISAAPGPPGPPFTWPSATAASRIGAAGGLFLVFEGGEGAGKSTQARALADWLTARGFDVVTTREPGATPLGRQLRSLLLDHSADAPSPRAEALLYAADRAQHVATVIRPALARGAVVLCDRYVDSSLAYQGAGRELAAQDVEWLSRWATADLTPDLVVLLDVDPAIGLTRAADRGAADRLEAESLEFHRRVRRAFLDRAAADPRRYLILDASTSESLLTDRIQIRVAPMLGVQPTVEDPAQA